MSVTFLQWFSLYFIPDPFSKALSELSILTPVQISRSEKDSTKRERSIFEIKKKKSSLFCIWDPILLLQKFHKHRMKLEEENPSWNWKLGSVVRKGDMAEDWSGTLPALKFVSVPRVQWTRLWGDRMEHCKVNILKGLCRCLEKCENTPITITACILHVQKEDCMPSVDADTRPEQLRVFCVCRKSFYLLYIQKLLYLPNYVLHVYINKVVDFKGTKYQYLLPQFHICVFK